jgi:DNA polymerase III epsilon subunit-like protein
VPYSHEQPAQKSQWVQSSAIPNKFTEKHLIESLSVGAVKQNQPVMYFSMLNQGNKRGKETQVLALDCERIKTTEGERLARVSIVNYYGNIVFDTLVKPCDYHGQLYEVIDYREWITGIKQSDLAYAPCFSNIAPILQKILRGKTIVGHSLEDDLEILKVDTVRDQIEIRDTSDMDFFMNKIDKDSKSPVKLTED